MKSLRVTVFISLQFTNIETLIPRNWALIIKTGAIIPDIVVESGEEEQLVGYFRRLKALTLGIISETIYLSFNLKEKW